MHIQQYTYKTLYMKYININNMVHKNFYWYFDLKVVRTSVDINVELSKL